MDDPNLHDLAKKIGAKLIIQVGSTVTGHEHRQSDLDVGVLLGRQASFDEFSTVSAEVQEHFPGRDVDLAMLDSADPLFAWRVASESRLRWGSERAFHE